MKNNLAQIATVFLKLGFIGFGGPAVHIAMMRAEVVEKRKWISEQHFLDLIGATNLIPGPNSTEMAIHIGKEKAGWKGLIIAGICFILPAVLITGFFAWLYREYGDLPKIQRFLYGIQPAIIAVIIAAIFPLAKQSLKTVGLWLLGIIALALSLLNFNEIAIMFGVGFLAILIYYLKNRHANLHSAFPLLLFQGQNTSDATNLNLFWIFLKIGSILYGSGYVLFAFLDAELVSTGMLSRTQLIDAIAVGQFTPGPVFSSVTFIGYQINGLNGAIIATIAIFLPSFLFVALLNPLLKILRNSPVFSTFLDAVNVASVAIIISICLQMGNDSIKDWKTATIAILSLILMFRFRKVNSVVIVLGGSVAGYLLTLI